MFSLMLCLIYVLGLSVLFGDISVNKWYFDSSGWEFKVDGTVQLVWICRGMLGGFWSHEIVKSIASESD